MQLSVLFKNKKTLTMLYMDEKLTVTYRPGHITPELQIVMNELGSDLNSEDPGYLDEMTRRLNDYLEGLSQVFVTWDLMDAEGKVFEPTPDNLSTLPWEFLTAVWREVVAHNSPNRKTVES